MRAAVVALVIALVAASCSTTAEPAADSEAAMAAALVQVATVDNTFGGQPVFDHFLVLDHTDPAAGSVDGPRGEARPLTDAESSAIESALSGLGEVEFVAYPTDLISVEGDPLAEGQVVLGVGEPDSDGDELLVGVSLWCNPLCGTWLTYRLALDGVWTVVGTEGSIAIS